MTLKLGIHMWPISSNNIPTQQDCKQQQIASGNQFINKLYVPVTTYILFAVVVMKVGMYLHGNVNNTP